MSAYKPVNNQSHTRTIVYLAMCTAVSLIFSYVESLVPLHMGIPGAKPGLPNIVTVTLLYSLGPGPALIVSIARILLSGFLFGNLFAIAYSAAGFFCSFCTMLLLKRSGFFGRTGVSTAGGVMHNVGQLAMAALLTEGYVFSYLPALIAAGTAAGVVVGLLSSLIAGRVDRLLRTHGLL